MENDYLWIALSAIILYPLISTNMSVVVSDKDSDEFFGKFNNRKLYLVSIFGYPIALLSYIFIKGFA
jgi:hypothetical protein